MADNGTAASGPTIAWDDIGGVALQRVKVTWGVDGSMVDTSASNPLPITVSGSAAVTGTFWQATQPVSAASLPLPTGASTSAKQPALGTAGSPSTDVISIQGITSGTALNVDGRATALGGFDVQASLTRPADTTAYAINDAMSDSTSAPTSGGFTLSGVARASGGLVMLTDILITSSKPSNLQGILYIFNQAATNNNDNAAFAMSDSDVANLVAAQPFTLSAETSNSWQHIQNLAITALCSGSADLRFLIKLTAAYTPDNAEVIKVRTKGLRLN